MKCLLDQSWMIGRYWIQHDINVSLIGMIVHGFTSLILLFATYSLIFLILKFKFAIGLITFIISLSIFYSFYSRLVLAIIVTCIYQYITAIGGYYFATNTQMPRLMVFIYSVLLILIFFSIQIFFCHKYCMGSIPFKIGPQWFPSYIDVLLKQFNEPYLILMTFLMHYQLFVDKSIIDKAKYFKQKYNKNSITKTRDR